MAKCNELGICESKAGRKAEKAIERIRTLKVSICSIIAIAKEYVFQTQDGRPNDT